MWLENPSGLVILLGCAHAGVINTLDRIHELSGGKPILAIIGGMHLGSATEDRMARTVEKFQHLPATHLWPCHCTGAHATARLLLAFGDRCHPCAVGMEIQV